MPKYDKVYTLERYKALVSEFRIYCCNHFVSRIPSHRFRSWFYRKVMKFGFEKYVSVLLGCTFDCKSQIKVGEYSTINQRCRIDNRGTIEIGKHVSISAEVVLLSASHDIQSKTFKGVEKKVVIDDFVFIGTRAMILPGVRIGKGAVIAAGAVVSKDVEPYTIVGGIPAKVIGHRNEELDYYPFYPRLLH